MLNEDRGSATAEFVVMMPAVLMVLVLAVGSIMLATQRVVLTHAAAEVARLEARGDDRASAERLASVADQVRVSRDRRGELYCVTLRSGAAAGLLSAIPVTARGCAALSEVAR